MNYLIIGPAWIGDMVMAQSLYQVLKQQTPDAVIDVLAPAWALPLLQYMPEVHHAIEAPLRHGELGLKVRYALGKVLRDKDYDRAIILPRSYKSALIPWFAKIPHRTGWIGEQRWGVVNDIRRLNKTRYPRVIDRYVALGLAEGDALPESLPLPRLEVPKNAVLATQKKFALEGKTKPVVALCPGAEYGRSKRWPARHFASLSTTLCQQGYAVWLLGSPKEKTVADEVQALSEENVVNLAGQTSLEEAVHVLSMADIAVTNDSGLMHIAAAVSTRVVALYGSSDPTYTPPLTDKATILSRHLSCSPCFKRECPFGHYRCLEELEPTLVLESIAKQST